MQTSKILFVNNKIIKNYICFIRHIDVYFQLQYVIKVDNIEFLYFALQNIYIVFQVSKDNTFKYIAKLIQLYYLFCINVAIVKLQNIILANNLVNLQEVFNKCFEIDQLLEYLNNIFKNILQVRQLSIKILNNLLKKIALIVLFIFKLQVQIYCFFSLVYKEYYLNKNIIDDF